MQITAKLEATWKDFYFLFTDVLPSLMALIFCWVNDINKGIKNSGKYWKSAALLAALQRFKVGQSPIYLL